MTQNQRLLSWLKSGRSITRAQAFSRLGICELASRIGEIELKIWEDWFESDTDAMDEIHRERVKVGKAWVTRYSLK